MTAPDVNDVRARFEAHHGITWAAIQSLPIGSGSRLHLESHYKRHLDTWQAAHADLSGEVTKLLRDVRSIYIGQERPAGDGCDAETWDRIEATLAKFHPTHQEKP